MVDKQACGEELDDHQVDIGEKKVVEKLHLQTHKAPTSSIWWSQSNSQQCGNYSGNERRLYWEKLNQQGMLNSREHEIQMKYTIAASHQYM